MKLNLKKLAALTSSLLVVACNGGGGASGGDTPPGPGPSPTPPVNQLQPLSFQSIGTPLNLNKVGGNAVWYMLVTNPNSEKVTLNTIDNNTNSIFVQNGQMGAQNYNTNIIHPMDYAESYSQEVSGYTTTPDCLSLVNGTSLSLSSGQSCVYKFRAFWNSNLDMPQVNNFKIDYVFYSTKGKSYCTSALGQCDYSIPYNSNNTLSYQSTNISSQDVVESMLGFSNFLFSGDGSTVLTWVQQSLAATQSVSTYSVNYNSTTNKLSLSNQQNYSGWTPNGSFYFNFPIGGFLSYDGGNFGAGGFNNMTTLGWNQLNVNGTNGTIYTSSSTYIYQSSNGDFTNSSNYSIVSGIQYSASSYNLIAFDENNNIAVLYKPSTGQNFCYNMNNGVYTELYNPASVQQKYNFQSNMPLNGNLPVFNGKIYVNAGGLYGVGQNGMLYLNKSENTSTIRVLNTVNCSISSNLDFYNFSISSGIASNISSTITASTTNYSLINSIKANTTYLINNSNI